MVNTATNQEREMRVAVERVVGFAQEFGEAHLNLACHAAFSLSLTPDLLYQIWANFVPEAPWTAVARVLLSRLCKEVGSEMYEMDNAVRNLLLRSLKEQFGQERFDSLGEFLLEYVSQRLTTDDPDTQDLRQAQEWTALAYTKPEQAARELAKILSDRVQQEDVGEVLRLSSLVGTLSEPLIDAGFEPLLVYGQGMNSYVCGDLATAKQHIEKIQVTDNTISLAGINLNIPQILSRELSRTHYEQKITQSNSELSRNDDFYIDRPPIEQMCFDAISRIGTFIRIKAPHEMGKTLLLNKILDYGYKQSYKTVYLNFQLVENSIFTDYEKFLKWFCVSVTRKLKLPNRIDEYWDKDFSLSMNCSIYFEDYILTELKTFFVLGIDEIGQILINYDIARNFLAMLRSWHEQTRRFSKTKETWHKLKLIFTHSLEFNIVQNINTSPLTNIGVSVILPEFSLKQVTNLAIKYRLRFNQQQIRQIVSILGGHPYLINYLFEAINYNYPKRKTTEINLEETINQIVEKDYLQPVFSTKHLFLKDFLDGFLKLATTDAGIYSSHLQQKLLNLQKYPALLESFKEVLISPQPIRLESDIAFQLEATGLVKVEKNLVTVRNKLYYDYFHAKLISSKITKKKSEEKSVDFTNLENLLATRQWKKADKETATLMFQITKREEQRCLRIEDIEQFPIHYLEILDQLWVDASNGHFGFSVQLKTWQKLGTQVNIDTERKLGELLGWFNFDEWWIDYSELTFSLEAPIGHLPAFWDYEGINGQEAASTCLLMSKFAEFLTNRIIKNYKNKLIEVLSEELTIQEYEFKLYKHPNDYEIEGIKEVFLSENEKINIKIINYNLESFEKNTLVLNLKIEIEFAIKVSYYNWDEHIPEIHEDVPSFEQIFSNQLVQGNTLVEFWISDDLSETEYESLELYINQPIEVNDRNIKITDNT